MYMRSMSDRVNIRPGRIAFAKKVSFPTSDCSWTWVQVRLVHQICIFSMVSAILSGGMDIVRFCVFISMPKYGTCRAGPAILSSATGMLSLRKVNLNSLSSCIAFCIRGTENIKKSSE